MTADAVVAHYQALVLASYEQALAAAESLRDRISAFVAAPSEAGLAASREAWITAHVAYAPTETCRFYEGPIDNGVNGVEAALNGWPMDEGYVDYVAEKPEGGLINDPGRRPFLDAASLAELNEQGGSQNIATGFHAIEFLLWGQDTRADGPGDRSWRDFADDGGKPHPQRRRQYLASVADLLLEHLRTVIRAWRTDTEASYGREFVKNRDGASLAKIFTGMAMMAGHELAVERMFVAYDSGDQEDEESCFSDTTLLTLRANAEGIRNVYLGRFRDLAGPSPSDLIRQLDPSADGAVRAAIDSSQAALAAIPAPLDRVITAPRDAPERATLLAAVEAMERQTQTLVAAAKTLGLTLNLDYEAAP